MLGVHDSRRRSQNHLDSSFSNSTSFASTSSPSSLPSPPLDYSTTRTFFANPSPSDFNGKAIQHYLDSSSSPGRSSSADDSASAFVLDTSNIPISSIDQYMANNFGFHSSPSSIFHGLSNLGDGSDNSMQLWASLGQGNHGMTNNGVANQMQQQALSRSQQPLSNHSRAPSVASMGSQSSGSPYQTHRGQPQSHAARVTDQASHPRKPSNLAAGPGFGHRQSALPTPTQTPTQDSFTVSAHPSAGYGQQSNGNINQTVAASLAMNNALLDPNAASDEDHPGMTHSGRPSFSSGHGPATPMASMGGDMNEQGIKAAHNGENMKPYDGVEAWLNEYLLFGDDSGPMVPKLERTVTDAYNDELYLPSSMPVVSAAANPNYLVPHPANPMVSDRLHAAQMARSNSSQSSQSRGLSPFQTESPWTQQSSMRPGSQLRQSLDQPDSSDLGYQTSPHSDSEPKTISPKEAMLDYKPDENDMPLFPQSSTYAAQQAVMAPSTAQHQFAAPNSGINFNALAATTGAGWNPALQSMGVSYQGYGNMMASSMPMNGYSTYSMSPSARAPERNPEFPAHLTSMDSSASEAAPPSSMASTVTQDSMKPVDSSAHTGTYTCTYHGCSERFSTPQKLQKHKRDAHRKSSGVTPGVGSGMSTAELMERNSQTGPHKCDRLNPTTGKPCNTIFSRPYDLTRHEDTIHNIRKQKVRCALCQEEKTFSRADALTRHMRVVHPEVDFPGKHTRRRGGSSP